MQNISRVYAMPFAKVYAAYVAKAERKGRTKSEVDEVIHWLTGYTAEDLETKQKDGSSLETFVKDAPRMNPARTLITGTVCGVRVEAVADQVMREVRYLDKLVDELAKGWPMERVLRRG